jgi:hypothetical protein
MPNDVQRQVLERNSIVRNQLPKNVDVLTDFELRIVSGRATKGVRNRFVASRNRHSILGQDYFG